MRDRVIWGGRYAIYDELASGGMATVYLAGRLGFDAEIPAVVALKKLSAQFAKQPEFVAMFLDEAHLAARIRHPNVVATYEFLRTDEGLGIVMDLVIGMSLMELVRGANASMQIPPPLPIALAIVTGALDGLEAAHASTDDRGRSLSLVHRDVSPHNILVGADGVPRVIDFGIAKAAGRLQVTEVGVLKGKFAYMSPEQIQGAPVDRRADIYAAGVVLWELLAGRKLFRASSNEELLNQRTVGTGAVAAPSTINRGVSPELDAIVARALAVNPGDRYESARVMAREIRGELDVADADAVAGWVRSRASDKLDRLTAKRQALLDALAEEDPDGVRDRSSGLPPVRSPRASLSGVSTPTLEGAGEGAMEVEPLAAEPVPRAASPVAGSASTLRSAQERFSSDIELADVEARPSDHIRIDLAVEDTAALRESIAAQQPRMGGRPPRRAPEKRSFRGGPLLLFLVLLLGLSGAVVVAGPQFLKARIVATAATEGVTLAVERVSLASGGVHLEGVTATLPACPSVRLSATTANLTMSHTGAVEAVVLPAFELSLVGPASEVTRQIEAWRKQRHAGPTVDGTAGRVVWKGAFASLDSIQAEGAIVSVSAAPDAAFTFDSANVRLDVPRGHIGPWRARVESAANETRARISLDPSVPDAPPTATLTQRASDGTTWALDIPRGSSFKIGASSQIFGTSADLAIEVALHAHLTPAGDALTAEGQIGLYGWPLGPGKAGTPVDLVVSGSVAGDPKKPLAINGGKLAIGKSTGVVVGTVTVGDSVRLELDRPATKGAALVIDTAEWTKAPPAR